MSALVTSLLLLTLFTKITHTRSVDSLRAVKRSNPLGKKIGDLFFDTVPHKVRTQLSVTLVLQPASIYGGKVICARQDFMFSRELVSGRASLKNIDLCTLRITEMIFAPPPQQVN